MPKSLAQFLRHNRTLVVLILLLLFFPLLLVAFRGSKLYKSGAAPLPGTLTLSPIADARVQSNAPNGTLGNCSSGANCYLRTRYSGPSISIDTSNSYLKFDLSTLPAGATLTSATLRLTVRNSGSGNDGSSATQQVGLISDNSWSETTITYNNAPALPTKYLAEAVCNAKPGEFCDLPLDLSQFPISPSQNQITLTLNTCHTCPGPTDELNIDSREVNTGPQLNLTYSFIGPIGSSTPTPTSSCTPTSPSLLGQVPSDGTILSYGTTTVDLTIPVVTYNTCTNTKHNAVWTRNLTLSSPFVKSCQDISLNTSFITCSFNALQNGNTYEWYTTASNENSTSQSPSAKFSIRSTPTTSIVNSASNQSCYQACSAQNKLCVGVGISADNQDGTYRSSLPSTSSCDLATGATCSTIMTNQNVPDAVFPPYVCQWTRCLCADPNFTTPTPTPAPTTTPPPSACNLNSTWTQAGSDVFDSLTGIASDSSSNVYITHNGHDVVVTDQAGNYLRNWGTQGSNPGQIFSAYGIHVDNQTNVYIPTDHRIEKFTATGTFQFQLGSPLSGSGNGQFAFPQDVTTDAAGNIYVADSGNYRVQKFSSAGIFITKWGSQGSGPGQFSTYFSITADPSGNIYTAESNRVQVFSSTGTYLSSWTVPTTITDINSDSSGYLYITTLDTSAGTATLNRYSSSGYLFDQTYLPVNTTVDFPTASAIGTQNQIYISLSVNKVLKYTCPAVVLPSATPPVPTITPLPTIAPLANFEFYIPLNSITTNQSFAKTFTVTLVPIGANPNNYPTFIQAVSAVATSPTPGLWHGQTGMIVPTSGTIYDIYIKSGGFLQRYYGSRTFSSGSTVTISRPNEPLIAGDMTGDNTLQLNDITAFISAWTSDQTLPSPTTAIFNLNGDNFIDLSDLTIMITDWGTTKSIIYGDQP